MSDILTDEQVREIALAIGHKPFVGSLIATLRHVQAERDKADKDKEYWRELSISQREDADAEVESLQADSERLQQENARLRELLTNLKDEITCGCETCIAEANYMIDKALATEGEGNG